MFKKNKWCTLKSYNKDKWQFILNTKHVIVKLLFFLNVTQTDGFRQTDL